MAFSKYTMALLGATITIAAHPVANAYPSRVSASPTMIAQPLPNFPANSRLLAAAQSGDVAALRAALKSGASPDAISEFGDHAVNVAAMSGNTVAAQLLINAGADINAVSSLGRTPLMDAAASGNNDLLMMLLLHRASTAAYGTAHETALHLAAESGSLTEARALLLAGAEPNAVTDQGETALMLASRSAAWRSQSSDFAFLADRSDVNLANRKRRTALMIAAESGAVDEVKALIMRGARATSRDSAGRTALLLASQSTESSIARRAPAQLVQVATANYDKRQAEIVALLAALTPARVEKVTAMLVAAASGCPGAMRGLVEQGVPINDAATSSFLAALSVPMIDKSVPQAAWPAGMTPLMVAAATGKGDVVKLLLSIHANAGARDAAGRTAIMYAARFGRVDIVQALIHHGVDVDAVDNDGKRPLMHVAELGWSGMLRNGWAKSLMPAGENPPDAIIVNLLAQARVDFTARDLKGKTAAEIAHESGNEPISRLIAEFSKQF
ncbi:MAG TPA: ankyrin repeat domain-containing protein [Capsulimonadaceae bacterium]|jgi:ankyrin repeat protein